MTETRSQMRDEGDDWSQISNKVMRKRVQNRLAQRNYRKGIKARLKQLEQLATREGSPATTTAASTTTSTTATALPASAAPVCDPSPVKELSASSTADMSGLTSPEVPMPGAGFSLDGSTANFLYPRPSPDYPTVSASLSLAPAMPVLRDMSFANTFSVNEWPGDSGMSPTTSLLAQQGFPSMPHMAAETHPTGFRGLAGEIDSLGRYLDPQRQAMECQDMQTQIKSTASGISADQQYQSTDPSTAADTVVPSNPVSVHENDTSVGGLSSRTSLSKHSSRASCGSIAKDFSLDGSAALSSRIASAMAAIRDLGFSGIEDLTAQFYTADLQDRPSLAEAQRISRRRGLSRILASVREHAKDDWTDWEAQGYHEEIVRTAEDILGEECRRFSEEDDARFSKIAGNAAELKRQFQEELPNLYGLLGVISLSSQQWGDADHSTVVVQIISSLLRGPQAA